jgi:hypothetical protein
LLVGFVFFEKPHFLHEVDEVACVQELKEEGNSSTDDRFVCFALAVDVKLYFVGEDVERFHGLQWVFHASLLIKNKYYKN